MKAHLFTPLSLIVMMVLLVPGGMPLPAVQSRPVGPAVAPVTNSYDSGVRVTFPATVTADAQNVEFVGHIGGITDAVAVQGNYAYTGFGPELAVLDISVPAHPVRVGYEMLPDKVEGIYIAGHYAYVADGSAGLRVVDISTPIHPTEVGVCDTPRYAWDVAIAGGYAYVVESSGGYPDYDGWLRVFDVSVPSNPREVGFYDTSGDAYDVAVAGSNVYIADGDDGLRVINVSVPTNPREVGFYNTPGDAGGVAIAGGYAYVADWNSGLRVVDVSNPANPREVGFYDRLGSVSGVTVAGNYAYVDSSWGLRVVNISTPTNPIEVGFCRISVQELFVAGNYVYAAARDDGLRVVDVADPANPREVGFYDTPGAPNDVAVVGGYAYTADEYDGLRVVDISTPTNPREVGFYDRPLGAYGVAVAGEYAYVADGVSGLRVVDVSDPTNPREVGLNTMYTCDLDVSGSYAYVTTGGTRLRVVDVSDPASPREVGSCSFPDGAWTQTVAVAGSYAYVSAVSHGLRIVNISTPSSPREVGYYDTEWATSVAVAGNYAYVADGRSGLRVVDVSTPSYPREVGFCDTPGFAFSVAVAGNYAYVADEDGGLRVVDVSMPTNPREVGFYHTPGGAVDVAFDKGYIYVASGYGGLFILRYPGAGPIAVDVVKTTPADQAAQVPLDTSITATFNMPVDPTTLNENTMLVSDGSFDLLGSVTYDNATSTVRFRASRFTPLYPATTYTVTLTDEIAADSPTNTLQTYQWSFATETYSLDSDHDGLTDTEEREGWLVGFHYYDSDPFKADTDGDGLNDLAEKRSRTDPRNADTDGDDLKDGEEDKLNYGKVDFAETDPRKWDTDGDGLRDGDDPVPYVVTNRKALVIWLMEYPEGLRQGHPGLDNFAPSEYEGIGDLRWILKYLGFDVKYQYDVPDGHYFFTYRRISNWIQEFVGELDSNDVVVVAIHTHGHAQGENYEIAYGDGIYSEDDLTDQLKQLDSRLDFLWLLTCHSWAFRDELGKLDTGGIVFFGSDGETGALPAAAGFYSGIAGAEWDESLHWIDCYNKDKDLQTVEEVISTVNAVEPEKYRVWKVLDNYPGDMDLLSPWLSPQVAVTLEATHAQAQFEGAAVTPTASFSNTSYIAFDSNDDGYTDAITVSWSVESIVTEEDVFVSVVTYDGLDNPLEAYMYGPYTIHGTSIETKSVEFYASISDTYRVSLDLYSLPATLSDIRRIAGIPLRRGPGSQDGDEAFVSALLTVGDTLRAGKPVTVTWSATTTLPSEGVLALTTLSTNPETGTVLEVKDSGPYTIYNSFLNSQVTTLTLPGSGVYSLDLCLVDSDSKVEDCTELKLWATGIYSDTGVDTDGDGLYDGLAVNVGLRIPHSGNYTLSGSLYDETGDYVASAYESGHFSAGTSTARLVFDGETVRKSRHSGPYVLRDVKLVSDDGSSDMIGEAYTTSTYDHAQFELPTAMFSETFTDTGRDDTGDGLWDALSIDVGLEAALPGIYEVSGYLSDSSGNQISYQVISQTLGADIYTVTLDFDGLTIARNGVDGPYVLERLTLRSSDGEVLDRIEEAYFTQSYSHTQFQSPPAVLSGAFGDRGVDLDGNGLYDFLTIDVGLTVTTTGLYRLEGVLADQQGNIIRLAGATVLLNAGQRTVQLNFDGQAIRRNRASGVFKLVYVNLIDYYAGTWRYLDQRSDAYVTRSYRHSDFGEKDCLFLPLIVKRR